jgi:OmcA/MtrC family decaheme c-type cytochrome
VLVTPIYPVAWTDTSTVTVRFNVKVAGVNRNDFLFKATDTGGGHNEDAYWQYKLAPTYTQVAPNDFGPAGVRTKFVPASWTLAANGNGNYTAVITGVIPAPEDGVAFQLSTTPGNGTVATAVAYFGGVRANDTVGDAACIKCHDSHVWRGAAHDVTNPQGVGSCVVCHSRVGAADPAIPGAGSGLMGMIHGIHNSKNMPGGVYTFTWTNGNKFDFSIGFPSFMDNCSNCHDSTARLDAVKDAPVTYALCMSCHLNWDGFPTTVVGGSAAFHRSYTATSGTVCSTCHTGALATIAGFHNGLKTERAGLIWGGADQSVVLGAAIDMQITGVTFADTTTLAVTWTATQSSVAVNPCNSVVADGPVFIGATANTTTGQAASNMSLLKGIAQADDWVNAGQTGNVSPGQPIAVNLTTTNTTCASNVATSRIPRDTYQAASATKGIVGLQGKPQVRFAPAIGTVNEVIQVRAKSPVREYLLTDGALPPVAAQRRSIVDTAKCLDCHQGSLYQHGGNRVDNVNLCVECHNPAANEKNVRVNMGVTAAEAYDGKAGEAYDMRNMTHAIHSAQNGMALVYYRTNGVYFFGTKEALAAVANWPGTGCQIVAGSGAPSSATGAQCNTAITTQVTKTHNFIEVHYPQAINNCAACHSDTWVQETVNATKGVALTTDPGAAPWGNQLDDVLMGATAASCMSCHQSGVQSTQFGLRIHAYGQGWVPATFVDGRQTIIDAASTIP